MAAIGDVQEMLLRSLDQLGKSYDTKVNISGLKINPGKTYQEIDTAQRALCGLTSNTYNDTYLITKVSVNEVLAEEAENG